MNKMNPEVKAMWIEALLSGRYIQGKRVLTRIINGEEKDCCLGVLCKLAQKLGIIHQFDIVDENVKLYDHEDKTLPYRVMEWAGLRNDNAAYWEGHSLAHDNGKTFTEIAAIIERWF